MNKQNKTATTSLQIASTIKKRNLDLIRLLRVDKPHLQTTLSSDGTYIHYPVPGPQNRSCRRSFRTAYGVYPSTKEYVSIATPLSPLVPYSYDPSSPDIRDLFRRACVFPKLKTGHYQILFPLSPETVHAKIAPFTVDPLTPSASPSPLAVAIRSGIVEFGPDSSVQVAKLLSAIETLAHTPGGDDLLGTYSKGSYYSERASFLFLREPFDGKKAKYKFIETKKCIQCSKPLFHHSWGSYANKCTCPPDTFRTLLWNKTATFMVTVSCTKETTIILRSRKDIRINRSPKASAKYQVPTLEWGPTKRIVCQRIISSTDTSFLDYRQSNEYRYVAYRRRRKGARRKYGVDDHIAAHPFNYREWEDR